jgi:hypothetical protein
MSQRHTIATLQAADPSLFIAGLSNDGSRCLYTDIEGIVCNIYHVETQHDEHPLGKQSLKFNDLQQGEYLVIKKGSLRGQYRLFGGDYNYPLTENSTLGIKLNLDMDNEQVVLTSLKDSSELDRIKYRTNDWVSATFSAHGSTLAIIEPYSITFFRYTK